jgi:hypothetical protein
MAAAPMAHPASNAIAGLDLVFILSSWFGKL